MSARETFGALIESIVAEFDAQGLVHREVPQAEKRALHEATLDKLLALAARGEIDTQALSSPLTRTDVDNLIDGARVIFATHDACARSARRRRSVGAGEDVDDVLILLVELRRRLCAQPRPDLEA